MKCVYCHLSIEPEDYGWGYDQEGYDRRYWHCECIEEWEHIAL